MDLSQIASFTNNAGVGSYNSGQDIALTMQQKQAQVQAALQDMLLRQQAESRAQALLPSQIGLNQSAAGLNSAHADLSRFGSLPESQARTESENQMRPFRVQTEQGIAQSKAVQGIVDQGHAIQSSLAQQAPTLAGIPDIESRKEQINSIYKGYGATPPFNPSMDGPAPDGSQRYGTSDTVAQAWAQNPMDKATSWVQADPRARQRMAELAAQGTYATEREQIKAGARIQDAQTRLEGVMGKAHAMQSPVQRVSSLMEEYAKLAPDDPARNILGQAIKGQWLLLDNLTRQEIAKNFQGRIPEIEGIKMNDFGGTKNTGVTGTSQQDVPVMKLGSPQEQEDWIKQTMNANPGTTREKAIAFGKRIGRL